MLGTRKAPPRRRCGLEKGRARGRSSRRARRRVRHLVWKGDGPCHSPLAGAEVRGGSGESGRRGSNERANGNGIGEGGQTAPPEGRRFRPETRPLRVTAGAAGA